MNRFDKLLEELNRDMKRKGIRQKDISEGTGIPNATISNFLNGKALTRQTMDSVINYIDNPKNWKK